MKRYGLLGEKLSHSLSPELHKLCGDENYELFEVEKTKLAEFVKKKDFDGLNVTVPYKKAVMPLLSKTSELARRVGCVNTVVKDEKGKLIGYNTDVYGFAFLLDFHKIDVFGKTCAILGNGGGAAAVKTVLAERKAAKIETFGRLDTQKAEKRPGFDVLVNATPVGMYPNNGETPVDLDLFEGVTTVIDIIYNPIKTKLLLDAEKRGIKAVNGLIMLAAQGKRSRELFDDLEIDDSRIEYAVGKLAEKMQNIVLIGMPGAGKTSVGRALAEKTGKRFIDLDETIEKLYGKKPESIIRLHGEREFRRTERVAAAWAGKFTGAVIATGGGVVTVEENLGSLSQNGKIVYVKRDLKKLAVEGRPLSAGKSVEAIFSERKDLYERWKDIEIDNNGSIDETVSEIIKKI
ncbi:MAG: shikimate kinase [Clostridia bacterium]|nr:shikimate kinase [Clostridia bacterium]